MGGVDATYLVSGFCWKKIECKKDLFQKKNCFAHLPRQSPQCWDMKGISAYYIIPKFHLLVDRLGCVPKVWWNNLGASNLMYSQKRNSSFRKGRPLIRDNGGLQSWNHSFFPGLAEGPSHLKATNSPRKQATGGHDVLHWNKKSNSISWICVLRSSLLGAGDFEALRKVSQIEIQSTVCPKPNVIMSSSTNLCLTSCISRNLPPKMKHPEMDMCNSWCQNDIESNSMSKF